MPNTGDLYYAAGLTGPLRILRLTSSQYAERLTIDLAKAPEPELYVRFEGENCVPVYGSMCPYVPITIEELALLRLSIDV
jgi:hypothetical protein